MPYSIKRRRLAFPGDEEVVNSLNLRPYRLAAQRDEDQEWGMRGQFVARFDKKNDDLAGIKSIASKSYYHPEGRYGYRDLWHGRESPVQWPMEQYTQREDVEIKVEPESYAATGTSRLPELSLLLHTKRQAHVSGRTVEEVQRMQQVARVIRQRNKRVAEDEMEQAHRSLTSYIQHPGGVSSPLTSTATTSSTNSSPGALSFRDSMGSNSDGSVQRLPHKRLDQTGASRDTTSRFRGRTDSSSSMDSFHSTPPLSSTSESSPTSVPPMARTLAKTSRYLREIDRRTILQRITNGEKQASLAKEYQVSRAAICNLNKHRAIVLSRQQENPLAKHPKRPRVKCENPQQQQQQQQPHTNISNALVGGGGANGGGSSQSSRQCAGVYELQSRAVALLWTPLKDQATTTVDFRHSADRLVRLLVEEAMAFVPLKPVDGATQLRGVEAQHAACAVAVESTGTSSSADCGSQLLTRMFRTLEPDRPTGAIRFAAATSTATDDNNSNSLGVDVEVDAVDLAFSVRDQNVFLFDLVVTEGSSGRIRQAIATLVERGAREQTISLVALRIDSHAAESILLQFPYVKIVTAHVVRSDLKQDNQSSRLVAAMLKRRFHEIYNTGMSTTTRPQKRVSTMSSQ